jgi:3-methyladenine DNA glycosylase AlkD
MSTTEIDSILAEIERLSTDDKKLLIKRVVDLLDDTNPRRKIHRTLDRGQRQGPRVRPSQRRSALDDSIADYAARHGGGPDSVDLEPALEGVANNLKSAASGFNLSPRPRNLEARLSTTTTQKSIRERALSEVLTLLYSLSDPEGVKTFGSFGVYHEVARSIGKDHRLAQELWLTGSHEAQELATMIADPKKVTEKLMEAWVKRIDSWDMCDLCCRNLWNKTPFAYRKARAWSSRPEEFVKRAAFSLMASLAVHDKEASDGPFLTFLPMIKRESVDERDFVKKAVNWAPRQIGKRNFNLNRRAIETARELQRLNSTSARWIAADAMRELTNNKVQRRIND